VVELVDYQKFKADTSKAGICADSLIAALDSTGELAVTGGAR
jgi:hypothetical protein